MHPTQEQTNGFACLNLSQDINRQLDRLGFVTPTPIQAEAIPHALAGRDVIGIAQTGTGKTFAFGLPMIQKLLSSEGMALILAPTRELALQIDEELKKIGSTLGLRTAVLIGGAPMNRQVSDLRRRPNVIVATPGRLKDHLYQRTTNLRNVSIVVLDEADRMFDMGFAPVVREILDQTPSKRQTMLFSATMPREIVELTSKYQTNPIRVEVAPQGTPSELVDQEVHVVEKDRKPELLSAVLYENQGTVLVFSRTRHGARKVARNVRDLGISAAELHSDRTLAQRKAALAGFKSGEFRVLVATDIAARGIDVKEIGLVINYDLPDCIDDYVHRIGRTGRAGASGRAVSFAQPDQHRDVREIERLIGKPLAVMSGSLPPATVRGPRPTKPSQNHRPHRPENKPRFERSSGAPQADRSDRPNRPFGSDSDRKPRFDKPFTPRPPKPQAEVKPTEPTEDQKHQRPKPVGTPKQFQKTDKKPRWNSGRPTSSEGPRSQHPSGPQAHRPGIGGSAGNRTDRPAYGGGRSGPKRFGKPNRGR
jgi:ATP-dependent RNA helicase RhlE